MTETSIGSFVRNVSSAYEPRKVRKNLGKAPFYLYELKGDFLKLALSIRNGPLRASVKRAWSVIVSISLAAQFSLTVNIPLIAYIFLYYVTSRLGCLRSLAFQDK